MIKIPIKIEKEGLMPMTETPVECVGLIVGSLPKNEFRGYCWTRFHHAARWSPPCRFRQWGPSEKTVTCRANDAEEMDGIMIAWFEVRSSD